MNLRKLLSAGAVTATLFGVLAASAANASAAPAKVSLTWWTWTTNPQHVIANFEKAYPNITIQMPPELRLGRHFLCQAHDGPGRRHWA